MAEDLDYKPRARAAGLDKTSSWVLPPAPFPLSCPPSAHEHTSNTSTFSGQNRSSAAIGSGRKFSGEEGKIKTESAKVCPRPSQVCGSRSVKEKLRVQPSGSAVPHESTFRKTARHEVSRYLSVKAGLRAQHHTGTERGAGQPTRRTQKAESVFRTVGGHVTRLWLLA